MMKLFCVLFFLFFLHVEAQRRTQTRQELTNSETSVRGRGRSRFTNTETEYARPSETPSRRIPSRRKQEPVTLEPVEKPNYPPPVSSTQSYAVEEHIDEGGASPKLKALPEPNYEPQFISSKSAEADSPPVESGASAESSGERFSAELDIPTVKLDTDRSSLFREDVEDVLPKSNEKPVPITRNNVRSSSNRAGAERRVDVRNGGSKSAERGFRNGNSRNTYEQNVPSARNSLSRSRGENNIPLSRRPSVVEDSGPITRQEVISESPSLNDDSSSIANTISDHVKDENEIRKEIVRNSVPKLPSALGVGAILSEPIPPKKTIKKTLRSRVNTNSRNEETPILPRGRSSQNFETVPKAFPVGRTIEEYSPSARGRSLSSPGEDIQSARSRSNTTPKNIEPVTAGRSRTRATRRPTDAPQVATVPSRRNGRRRTDSVTTSSPLPRRGPSVFSAHEESPTARARTGRRIEPVVPKAQIEQTQSSRAANVRGRTRGAQVSTDQLPSSSSRKQNFRSRNEEQGTKPSRQRFNARSPPNIDESKLEVLPLFEGETKIISENGRKPNQLDELVSVPENDNSVIKAPEAVTPSISTRSDVSISSKVSSVKVNRRKPQRKTEIKESVVISQVTEVTSKRTITRKPVSKPGGKRFANKKSAEPKFNQLTSSEENISDSDNYPEPFKALIQSKKQVKVSRPSNSPVEDTKTKKIEKIVSSSEAPRSVLATPNESSRTTTSPIKYREEFDNEIHPKTSTTSRTIRPTKKRVSISLKNLETKNKKSTTTSRTIVSRSTLAPAKEPKEHKFHSKFNSATKSNAVPTPKPFNSSSAKGLSFNRKGKDSEKYSINKTRNAIEIGNNRGQYTAAPLHKSSRYSSRYRSNGSSRSAPRSSTAPPAYIPTIPSVRSYSSTVKPKEDPELGIEYITIDVPSRGISSANLIKGDYQSSEDANSNSLDSKQEKNVQTTEKPVSIIERIINSITGINITTEPTNVNFVAPSTPEPTRSSAILSLAPKKSSEKSSKTDDSTLQKLKSNERDAATSEKPTTIIQRILDSLSAIQATTTETTTVVTTDTPKQVGTNFNTLSATTTTPSQLDLETASFSSTLAPSTTINPLVVLDTISDEQVLQKRTIGKLLDILNSLTTQHPDSTKLSETTKLVYVTPKLSNYVYATPSSTSSGTLKTLTGITETTVKSQTPTQSSPQLFTSSLLNADSTTTTDKPSTITTAFTGTDVPLSVSLGLSSTPSYIEDNVLYSTTSNGIFPIIMNIKSLLAPKSISTSTVPTSTTTMKAKPTASSLFTPYVSTPLLSTTTTSSTTNVPPTTVSDLNSTMTASTEQPANSTISSTLTTEMINTTTNTMPLNLTEPTSLPPTTTTSKITTTISPTTESSTMPESTLVTEFSTVGETNIPEGTTVSSTESIFPYFSTIPTFSRFEVSPDSVSIFSANDLLSNAITPDDFLTSTISIPGKISDNFLSIGKTTYSTIDDKLTDNRQNTIKSTEKTTNAPVGTNSFTTQGRLTSTPTQTVPTMNSVNQQIPSASALPTTEDKTNSSLVVSADKSVNTANTSPSTTIGSSTTTSTTSGTTPNTGRKGKLLQNLQDEVSNNIDSSSMGPDYFIFAVLPNNTILRKRPTVYPKETPFVIVGVYPNNTVIRKYPNGTLVPMEPVIRVSGFDTRANPPPLPDITSNQVTPDQGNEVDNPKLEMVGTTPSSVNSLSSTTKKPENIPTTSEVTPMRDSTTVESISTEESPSSTVIPDNIISSTSPVPSITLPSISELLNGKTVQAYNSLVNNTPPSQDSTTKADNGVKTTTMSVPPTINKVTLPPSTFVTTTGVPSFLSTLITTLQSIGTTRLPVPIAATTQSPFRFSSTYRAPLSTTPLTSTVPITTTNAPPTTTKATTRATTTRRVTTTTRPMTTSTVPTTTTNPPPTTTTVVPTTITTSTPMVIMSETEDSSTPPPFTSKPAISSRTGKGLSSTTVFPYFNSRDFPLLSFFSTERPRRTNTDEKTTGKTTTTPQTTTVVTTTSGKTDITTESLEELLKKPIDSIKPRKKLTEQQKQDLEAIRKLEQEQAAILKQLSLLTNLNLNNFGNGQSGNLANRIISLAKERDSRKVNNQKPKPKTTTTVRTTTTTTTESTTTLKLKSEDEAEKERMRQIESLIKLLNMNGVTPSPGKETTYGTSNDAILAALLKERGIGPSTPKKLSDQLENSGFFTQTNEITTKPTTKTTRRTTRKPKPTTQPTRGPLLQRLNWLLDAFAPPPSTKAPSRKPKKITTKKPTIVEEDPLTNEPTHITPVVSPPPQTKKGNSISQDDIQKLIKQLEAIQKDPSAAKNLDLTSFKNLQSLNKDNVQVFMPGSSGVSERETSRPFTRAIAQKSKTTTEITAEETTTVKRKSSARAVRTSTFSPSTVSNSLVEDEEDVAPTPRARATLPPVRLRPVSGVSDDAGSMVRGRLLSAAVNVTRAISGFLGSAFQDAVRTLGRSLSSGSLSNLAGSSSVPRNSEETAIDQDYS